jgi:hypothetical protein
MGKGANKQLLNNSGTGQTNNASLNTSANDISSYLTPQLESEASNPQGYTPAQLAYMNTASQQSLGGGAAASTGQAGLTAARTRNAGGFQGAVGTADRAAQKQLSQNALGIQTQQAQLQQAQRQQALQSLQSLYGVDESTALGYLNSSDLALNDENGSHPNQNGLNTFAHVLTSLKSGGGSGGGGADGD